MIKIQRINKTNAIQINKNDGSMVLVSYSTPVAAYIPGQGYFRTEEFYSVTTSKHIKQWLGQAKAEVKPQAWLRVTTMKIGMLWFNNDPKQSLEVKVSGAVKYYQEKYHRPATSVYCNPFNCEKETTIEVNNSSIVVIPNKSVMPNHFWVGSET